MGTMLQVITGTTDGRTSVSGARWFAFAAVVATAIGSSMLTRKRALAGDQAILGVLF